MKIEVEVPDGKHPEWVNNVLTLVDEPKAEFKFKVGDTVKKSDSDLVYKILETHLFRGKTPVYKINDGFGWKGESELTLCTEQKDISKCIKTFEDAYKWCKENGKHGLIEQYHDALNVGLQRSPDIIAYLKLRIITCALNECWEPMFDNGEERYYVSVSIINNKVDLNSLCVCGKNCGIGYNESYKLFFKSSRLAEYAANQFKSIYMDFCYK